MPDEADGSHRASMILDVIRGHDIGIIENQQDLEFVFGRHCGMVAIPLTFDAENPNPDPDETLSLQFHHVNSMIEARVTSNPGDRRLAELVFDEVWFTVLAGEGQLPFSTEVEIDMTRISNGSSTTIPFSEFNNSKIGSMYTWILYDEIKTLGDMIGTNYYSIPIFALPTTSDFTWTVRVEFLLGGEPVATLERYSNRTAHGLNLSGLNPHNFTEGDLVFYEPLDPSDIDPGRGGDGGGGCGDDDDDDDDDDDQGEDNDDQ
jgi:hypothetical protein